MKTSKKIPIYSQVIKEKLSYGFIIGLILRNLTLFENKTNKLAKAIH